MVTDGPCTLTDSITKPTQVVTKKLKVLVVDGLPRVDFKFLQRALTATAGWTRGSSSPRATARR